jgi:hypothetical protein
MVGLAKPKNQTSRQLMPGRMPRALAFRSITMKSQVAILLFAFAAAPAYADTWSLPKPKTYVSRHGAYRLTVFPRDLVGARSYFEDKAAEKPRAGQRTAGQSRCEATLEKLEGSRYVQLWRKPLVNEVSPVGALVSDADGSFVTFDNWHSVGWGEDAIVIYAGSGEARRKLALTALMSQEDFEALPRSVSSIWWGGEHTLDSDEHTVNLRIVVGKKPGASVKEYRTAGRAPAPGRTRRPTGLQRLISRSHYDFVEVCLPCRIMCCIHYTS